MNKHKSLMQGMLVCGLVVSNASCVGVGLLGMPLGPQTSEGLVVEGVAAPTLSGGGCTFTNPATVFMINGEMEMGTDNSSPNEYIAILQTSSNRTSNACARTTTLQPNAQGTYGCLDTNGISIITANVRYEYPTLNNLSPSRFTNQQPPADGIFFANQTSADGYVSTGGSAEITVKVINKDLARNLAKDPDFQKRMDSDGSVPIIAHIRLEGRTDGGARAVSNELAFRIEARPTGAFENCTAAVTCPTGTSFQRTAQCFPGQDVVACACQ